MNNQGKVVTISGEQTPCFGTGQISNRMGVVISTEKLKGLGFTPVLDSFPVVLWRQDEFPAMCLAVAARLSKLAFPPERLPRAE